MPFKKYDTNGCPDCVEMCQLSLSTLQKSCFDIRGRSQPTYTTDTIQDFLCKLGIKPHMHLVEISIFSLNHAIARPTKIIKDLRKAST